MLNLIYRSEPCSDVAEPRGLGVFPKRFTLVELLTVVVIIAILMALLLPTLAKARYRARNVLCIGNQKQIALGVTTYSSDNEDWYPGDAGSVNVSDKVDSDGNDYKQIFYYRSAPSMLVASRGLDYATPLRSYFADTLKTSFICPLAPDVYQKGGAVDKNQPREIDSQVGVTSYAHYYGRIGNDIVSSTLNSLKSGISGSGFTGKVTTPTADSFWGSGDVFFSPYLDKGMLKAGKSQKFRSYYAKHDDMEHTLISSDVLWGWNDNWRWTHGTYGQKITPSSYAPGFRYGEYINSSGSEVLSQSLDYNYSTADGAVHSIPGVRYRDPRVTMTSGPKSQWTKAWVIPVPEN